MLNSNNKTIQKYLQGEEFSESIKAPFKLKELNNVSRRKFLALLAASAAFSSTACTDYRDKGEILPYVNRPEGILPGKANFYASACDACNQHCGILIKTREGRPIKLDGNPEHPINKGKICARGQASILNLYDPSRLKNPLHNNKKTSWVSALNKIHLTLQKTNATGKKIAFIHGKNYSQSLNEIFQLFKAKFPGTEFFCYEFQGNQNKVNAWEKCYGNRMLPAYNFDRAKIVLTLESDFLGRDGETIENIARFTRNRDADRPEKFIRLYSVESALSLTGMNADYRLRLNFSYQKKFLLALINELTNYLKIPDRLINKEFLVFARKFSFKNLIPELNINEKFVKRLVVDLIENNETSIIIAGDELDEEIHALVNFTNEILGARNIYDFSQAKAEPLTSEYEDFKILKNEMQKGNYGVVINFNTNFLYHFPEQLNFKEALQNISTVVTLTEEMNETAAFSNFVLPINNKLEAWGDYQGRFNVITFQQPVINPIFNTKQKEEILLSLIEESPRKREKISYLKFLKKFYRKNFFSGNLPFEEEWFTALKNGFYLTDKKAPSFNKFNVSVLASIKNKKEKGEFSLLIQKNYFIGDGKFANNGWLQEIPHPVSKITWDNYAAISGNTAKKLNVENNKMIEITSGKNKLKIPVLIQPGMADDLIVVESGYGRTKIGDVGKNVGFNVNNLIGDNWQFFINDVKVKPLNSVYKLASTQEHHSLNNTNLKDFHKIRGIIRESTLEEFLKDPMVIQKEPEEELPGITRTFEYKDVKWGMSIDLNKCIACGVCISSCNVENNVVVVGKQQVLNGREMQWIRIDRYYSGTEEEPQVSNQPMLCQQCDSAPCENVCPVNATNHSPDGLNQMVYNRCVGTRYCSNNCPYKVRRFNFFNYRDEFADSYYENDLTALANNPEVTVRSRGVMEKCTFCVQRIMESRSEAIKKGEKFDGSKVKTACEQACPADAIVFGNYNDENQEISIKRNHKLGYLVFEELNVRPNITYLAKLRNIKYEDKI